MDNPVKATTVKCDAACRALTKARFPAADSSYTDVNDVAALPREWLKQFGLLTGGLPCQDVSRANKEGEGLLGKRSGLF